MAIRQTLGTDRDKAQRYRPEGRSSTEWIMRLLTTIDTHREEEHHVLRCTAKLAYERERINKAFVKGKRVG